VSTRARSGGHAFPDRGSRLFHPEGIITITSLPPAARRRRPLPPVERVRPGLWSVPVPLPGVPRYVLVHVFETDAGPYLVDAGWDTDEAYAGLESGLAELGTRVADVQGVIVTHAHFDHYGLAGRIREASGAWISLHPLDAAALSEFEQAPTDRALAILASAGAPARVVASLVERPRSREAIRVHRPDILTEDGDRPPVPGWDLTAVWTPGHSPGHLCFWEDRHRLLLSGDHVLPKVAAGMASITHEHHDPLGDYLRALDRLGELRPDEVLPAHEHRFTGLHARLDELRAHHGRRLAEALAAVRAGAELTWDVASGMTWHRPLADLRGFALESALIDATACLVALRARGLVRSDVPVAGAAPARWRPAGP